MKVAKTKRDARFRRLYREGRSAREIAEQTGWSRSLVHRSLHDAGVELRHPKGPTFKESEAAVTKMWREYCPVKEMAEIVGVSSSTMSTWVGRIRETHGVPTTPPVSFPDEVWCAVPMPMPYREIYEVSSRGRVRNTGKVVAHMAGWVLCPIDRRAKYRKVALHTGDGTKVKVKIARLVCGAFYGAAPSPHHTVNHRDGVTHNDRSENLEWATSSEQRRHALHVLGRVAAVPRGSVRDVKTS